MHPLHSCSMMMCLLISTWTLNQVQRGTQQQISHLMCNNGYQMPHHPLWPRFQPLILLILRQGNVVVCAACISFLLTWSEHVAFATTQCPNWHPASGWQLYSRTSDLDIRCSTCSQLYPPPFLATLALINQSIESVQEGVSPVSWSFWEQTQ